MGKKKLCLIIGIVLVIILGVVVWFFGFTKDSDVNEGALLFKEEYEALNGEKAYGDFKYQSLDISETSKIDYSSAEEVIKVLEEGTGLIYFGFPNCPWCRGIIPTLLSTVDCSCLDKLYYLNSSDLRDAYKLEDGKPVVSKEASPEYLRILELLDKYLLDYTLEDEDGNTVEVGEKRLYVPMVVAVRNGTVVGYHIDSVTLDEGQSAFDKLTLEQSDELRDIFEDLIEKITEEQNVCDDHC